MNQFCVAPSRQGEFGDEFVGGNAGGNDENAKDADNSTTMEPEASKAGGSADAENGAKALADGSDDVKPSDSVAGPAVPAGKAKPKSKNIVRTIKLSTCMV